MLCRSEKRSDDMKKKIWIGVLMMLCVVMAVQGTIAYTTKEETTRNVITSGAVVVNILQQQEGSAQWQPYEAEALPVKPSDTVAKRVAVENEKESAWVRAKCEISAYDAQNMPMEIEEDALDELVILSMNTEDWVCKDGWWYYPTALQNGDRTEMLLESITFSRTMGNAFQGSTIHFDVIVQAVQTANNGTTIWEAAGWE